MLAAPCKDCPYRRPCCHSKCEKYLAFKAEREQFREYKNKQAAIYYYFRRKQ